jgi:hypothetical protein
MAVQVMPKPPRLAGFQSLNLVLWCCAGRGETRGSFPAAQKKADLALARRRPGSLQKLPSFGSAIDRPCSSAVRHYHPAHVIFAKNIGFESRICRATPGVQHRDPASWK